MMSGDVIFIEAFYGGSHKQLIDLLKERFGGDLYTLPAKKWHWRMRVSALHFALTIPRDHNYKLVALVVLHVYVENG